MHDTNNNEGIEASHLHVEASHQHNNSDGNNDNNGHDESCHVHLCCQLPSLENLAWAFHKSPSPQYEILDYRSLAEQPPVPPPTA